MHGALFHPGPLARGEGDYSLLDGAGKLIPVIGRFDSSGLVRDTRDGHERTIDGSRFI